MMISGSLSRLPRVTRRLDGMKTRLGTTALMLILGPIAAIAAGALLATAATLRVTRCVILSN